MSLPISLAASITGASLGAIVGLVKAVKASKQGGHGRNFTSRRTKDSDASAGSSTHSTWDLEPGLPASLGALSPGQSPSPALKRLGDHSRTAVWLQQVFSDSQDKDSNCQDAAPVDLEVRPGRLCVLTTLKSGSILRVNCSDSSEPRASHLYTETRTCPDGQINFLPSDALFSCGAGPVAGTVVFTSIAHPSKSLTYVMGVTNGSKRTRPLQLRRSTAATDQQWKITAKGLENMRSPQHPLGLKPLPVKGVLYEDVKRFHTLCSSVANTLAKKLKAADEQIESALKEQASVEGVLKHEKQAIVTLRSDLEVTKAAHATITVQLAATQRDLEVAHGQRDAKALECGHAATELALLRTKVQDVGSARDDAMQMVKLLQEEKSALLERDRRRDQLLERMQADMVEQLEDKDAHINALVDKCCKLDTALQAIQGKINIIFDERRMAPLQKSLQTADLQKLKDRLGAIKARHMVTNLSMDSVSVLSTRSRQHDTCDQDGVVSPAPEAPDDRPHMLDLRDAGMPPSVPEESDEPSDDQEVEAVVSAIVRESMEGGLEEVLSRIHDGARPSRASRLSMSVMGLPTGSGSAIMRGMHGSGATSVMASTSVTAAPGISTSMGASSMMQLFERLCSHQEGGELQQQQQRQQQQLTAVRAGAGTSTAEAGPSATPISRYATATTPSTGMADGPGSTPGCDGVAGVWDTQEEGEGTSSEGSPGRGRDDEQDGGNEGAGSTSNSPVLPGRPSVWDGLLPAGAAHDQTASAAGGQTGAQQATTRASCEGSSASHAPMSPAVSHPGVAPLTPPRHLAVVGGEDAEEDMDGEDPAMSPGAAATPPSMLFKAMHVLRSTGKRAVLHHRGASSDESDTEGVAIAAAGHHEDVHAARRPVPSPTQPKAVTISAGATPLRVPSTHTQQPVLRSAMKPQGTPGSTRRCGVVTPHTRAATSDTVPTVHLVGEPGSRIAAAVAALYPSATGDSVAEAAAPRASGSRYTGVAASQASDITLQVGEITGRAGEEATSAAMGARMINLVTDPISLGLMARKHQARQAGGNGSAGNAGAQGRRHTAL